MNLILRADDLGYSEAVNYGIEKTVKHGLIKNIGFMVNMPYSEHGLSLIKDQDVCLGLHTNISAGEPLCDPSLIPSIVGSNGQFKSSSDYRTSKSDIVNIEEVVLEIEAQYQKFLSLVGRKPQYFEGHAIESENFQKGLQLVAKKYGLKYSGISFDQSPIYINKHKVYMRMDSMLPNYDPLITLEDMRQKNHLDGFDLMVFHPGYLDNYILKNSSLTTPRTIEVEALCAEPLKLWLRQHNIKCFTYNDL